MFHYYLQKGHNLKELESLTATEKEFFKAGMQMEVEKGNQLIDGLTEALEGMQYGKKH